VVTWRTMKEGFFFFEIKNEEVSMCGFEQISC
jgi:hypothetical protein